MRRILSVLLIALYITFPCFGDEGVSYNGASRGNYISGACTGTEIQEYTSGTGYTTMFYYSGYYWGSGSFTTSSTTSICSIEVEIYKVGSPTGDITLYLYTDDAGVPDTLLATSSNTVDASTLPDAAGTYTAFTLGTSYTPTNATRYHIVLYKASNSSTNYVYWQTRRTSGLELTNRSNNGSTWTSEDTTADVNFRTKS
jgi:hypothetical protein